LEKDHSARTWGAKEFYTKSEQPAAQLGLVILAIAM